MSELKRGLHDDEHYHYRYCIKVKAHRPHVAQLTNSEQELGWGRGDLILGCTCLRMYSNLLNHVNLPC